MPELPEVETVVRSFNKELISQKITKMKFYRSDIRYPIPKKLVKEVLLEKSINKVFRRSKYILISTDSGYGIIHLGMSGKLLYLDSVKPQFPHTHVVFSVENSKQAGRDKYIHFIDPRRFGVVSACKLNDFSSHKMFVDLGVEPLECDDLGLYLWQKSRSKSVAIKTFLMNAKIVVGVGNIYAHEALFLAGIHPASPAGSVSKKKYEVLAGHIIRVLKSAIKVGGTSFRDFRKSNGDVGYFAQSLKVYGREGLNCLVCKTKIESYKSSGRTSWFCKKCQKKH